MFESIKDCVEITTLNAWGYRRIKAQARSPKLLTEKSEKHFAVMNQLAPVWTKYRAIEVAMKGRRLPAHDILDLMDALKSLGFDHTRMKSLAHFSTHVVHLTDLGLKRRLDDIWEKLVQIEVLNLPSPNREPDSRTLLKRVYDSFYKFWLEATDHLIKSFTFTFEDQKYYTFLYEKEKTNEADKALHGIARYDHVIVDEFQDINPLDINLIRAIVERHRSTITIVGDDDQAIFEWRGTTPAYILEPKKFFQSSFTTFTLQTNYRSPANIVSLAQKLIRNNQRRVDKDVRAHQPANAEIQIVDTAGLNESLDLAAKLVDDHINSGGSPTRIALIGRKKAHLIPYQMYFATKNVPFCAAEDLQIFLSKTFDRLLELLEIKQRSDIRQRPRQIAEELITLCDFVKRYPVEKTEKESLLKDLVQTANGTLRNTVEALYSHSGPLKGSNADRQMSIDYANRIREYLDTTSVSDALTALSDHFEGLVADFGKGDDDIFFKDPPFLQLAVFAQRYGVDYNRFPDDIETAKDILAFVPPIDDDAPESNDLQKRPLYLMTALRAKGNEFDTVIILDCIEDIWPMKYAQTEPQFGAERRVFWRNDVCFIFMSHSHERREESFFNYRVA